MPPRPEQPQHEERQQQEEESLEALVNQLNGITGVAWQQHEKQPKSDKVVLVPGRVTLTCLLGAAGSLEDKLGFRFQEQGNTTRVILTDVVETSPLHSLSGALVLDSINHQACTSLQQTHILIAKARPAIVTLECHVPNTYYHTSDRLVQAVVYKPSLDTPLGIRLGNTVVSEQPQLVVQEVVRNSLLGQSGLLSKGDVILALQGKPCRDMECQDATNYLKSNTGLVSFLALQQRQQNGSWWRPPPPHNLLAGGVKLMETAVSRGISIGSNHGNNHHAEKEDKEVLSETEGNFANHAEDAQAIRARAAALVGSGNQASSLSPRTMQRQSMKDRLQNLGRRLPFWDGGDQQAGAATDTPATRPSTNQRVTEQIEEALDHADDDADSDEDVKIDESELKNYTYEDSDDDDYSWLNVDLVDSAGEKSEAKGSTTNA